MFARLAPLRLAGSRSMSTAASASKFDFLEMSGALFCFRGMRFFSLWNPCVCVCENVHFAVFQEEETVRLFSLCGTELPL